MKSLRVLSVLAALVLVIGLIASCCPPPEKPPVEPTEEEKAEPKTLIIGTTDEVNSLDARDAYATHDWEIIKNTGDALMGYTPGTADLIPRLAEDFPEVSSDGKTYTFKLRAGIKFADGTDLKAQMVADSINQTISLGGDVSGFIAGYVESAEATDDLTVVFHLTQPWAVTPYLAATAPFVPVNPNEFSADELNQYPEQLHGVGPYMMTEHTVGEQMVLEKNPYYWDTAGAPKVDRIIIRYFADPTTMGQAVESGEIDIAWRILGPVEAVPLAKVEGLEQQKVNAPALRYICFQHQLEPVSNILVRQAIAAAVDREAIADRVFEGGVTPAYSTVPAGYPYAIEPFLDIYGTRDLNKAIDLLTQAGYSANNKLVLDFWYPPEHYGTTTADVFQLLTEQVEETGLVTVNAHSQNWATYITAAVEGQYPIYILGWFPDFVFPDTWLFPWADSTQSAGLGLMYNNPDMDALLVKAATAPESEQEALYHEAQTFYAEEVVTIPLFWEPEFITYREGITGIKIGPPFEFNYAELDVSK
ncbi:MAG: peptide ABC transporter substrate-binding protein [Anaerolineae bacterium]|nr:peptide ABC transporter substrate-binding protein [Anaerolineae bacterium]